MLTAGYMKQNLMSIWTASNSVLTLMLMVTFVSFQSPTFHYVIFGLYALVIVAVTLTMVIGIGLE